MSKTHYKDGMPKIWPQLDASDICASDFDGLVNSRHSLFGWTSAVTSTGAAQARIIRVLREKVYAAGYNSLSGCSDRDPDLAAKLWNAAGEHEGYVEWCEESGR